MNKKTIIWITAIMVSLIIFISLLFYFKYFNKSSKNLKENTIIKNIDVNQIRHIEAILIILTISPRTPREINIK